MRPDAFTLRSCPQSRSLKMLDGDANLRRRLAGMEATALETTLIAHAPDAIIFADCTGVIRLWNRGAETLFGYGAPTWTRSPP
jgi:PAS domain-containing protein